MTIHVHHADGSVQPVPEKRPKGPEDLLTEAEFAERASVSKDTLRNWRYLKVGPPFFKLGRVVRYGPDALAWLTAQRRNPAAA